ncbi:MAG: hypothetical protein K0R59_2667 [Sphingobacterium sp.]|jgi:hypothetical protein|nr:hypothetical protein [Sphingobacterium sp.]
MKKAVAYKNKIFDLFNKKVKHKLKVIFRLKPFI